MDAQDVIFPHKSPRGTLSNRLTSRISDSKGLLQLCACRALMLFSCNGSQARVERFFPCRGRAFEKHRKFLWESIQSRCGHYWCTFRLALLSGCLKWITPLLSSYSIQKRIFRLFTVTVAFFAVQEMVRFGLRSIIYPKIYQRWKRILRAGSFPLPYPKHHKRWTTDVVSRNLQRQ